MTLRRWCKSEPDSFIEIPGNIVAVDVVEEHVIGDSYVLMAKVYVQKRFRWKRVMKISTFYSREIWNEDYVALAKTAVARYENGILAEREKQRQIADGMREFAEWDGTIA